MSISIGNYLVEGPYTNTTNLQDCSGLYAIHCNRYGRYYLLDVGESATVK